METAFQQTPKSIKSNNAVSEKETTILMYFEINNTIVEIFQFQKKETDCIFLRTRNSHTKEKKIFAIIEGTVNFPFFETIFTLPHAIPSNLHLADLTDTIDNNDI